MGRDLVGIVATGAAIVLPSRWLDVFGGWGMTTLICGYLTFHVLRMRNEDWDLPRL